jgi:CheY-like chemotaxis protein
MPVARKTVLIVEDDGHLRRQLSLSLRLVGFETLEARGALEAIGLFERNRVDALVLDLTLPGLDGLTVKEEIAVHPRTRELPIVILTESQEPPQDVRPACVLKKPVTPWVVVATLVRCLRECRRDTT